MHFVFFPICFLVSWLYRLHISLWLCICVYTIHKDGYLAYANGSGISIDPNTYHRTWNEKIYSHHLRHLPHLWLVIVITSDTRHTCDSLNTWTVKHVSFSLLFVLQFSNVDTKLPASMRMLIIKMSTSGHLNWCYHKQVHICSNCWNRSPPWYFASSMLTKVWADWVSCQWDCLDY